MFDEARGTKLAQPRHFRGCACGGKGFLKCDSSLSGPGGSPRVQMNHREVTTEEVCACPHAQTHAFACCLSCTAHTVFASSFLFCISYSLHPLILLWEPTGNSIPPSWKFIPFGSCRLPLITPAQSPGLSSSDKTQPQYDCT